MINIKKCRNGCGYYGNPSWDYYCSQCYIKDHEKDFSDIRKASLSNLAQTSSNAFSKFEEKRKFIADKGAITFKNLFKISKDKSNTLTPDLKEAKDNFLAYINKFKSSISQDLVQQVSKIAEPTETVPTINAYSLKVQDFYTFMQDRIATNAIYYSLSAHDQDILMQNIEKFLTIWISNWALVPRGTNEDTVNTALEEKIRSLDWVTTEMLHAPLDDRLDGEFIEKAILSLINMSSVLSTEEKLQEIVSCCHLIYKAINACQTNSAAVNADDFVPALIWVVLKANPPQIHSNIQFITRFAAASKLNSGETGYYFTNLSCAVHFISNLDHNSLSMTEREFRRRMKGIHPPNKDCTPGQIMLNENEGNLLDIDDNLDKASTALNTLEQDLIDFNQSFSSQVSDILTSYPMKLNVKLDKRHLENPELLFFSPLNEGESGEASNLPQPLQPTSTK